MLNNQYVQDLDEQQQIIEADCTKKTNNRKKPKPVKMKTAPTPEQIRERNITWALNTRRNPPIYWWVSIWYQ